VTINPRSDDAVGFTELLAVMRRLRDPDKGCPWDLEQTHASLRYTLLEETYETLEAIDSGVPARQVEELGDLLLQVIFHAQIGADEGQYTIDDVVRHLIDKLVRRHPHIFGASAAKTATEVIGQWERIKAQERKAKGESERSMLDGVPKAMPSLAYAQAVQARAARAGFDWDDGRGAIDALAEEVAELRAESDPRRREEELGDVLFGLVAVARRMGIEAEDALRGANARFHLRFSRMEATLRERGETLAALPEPERLRRWERAKEPPPSANPG